MKKYVAGFILGVGLVLGVVSCVPSAGAEAPSGGMYKDTWHKMPDGRTVYCLYLDKYDTGYAAGAMSFECDFASATVHP